MIFVVIVCLLFLQQNFASPAKTEIAFWKHQIKWINIKNLSTNDSACERVWKFLLEWIIDVVTLYDIYLTYID